MNTSTTDFIFFITKYYSQYYPANPDVEVTYEPETYQSTYYRSYKVFWSCNIPCITETIKSIFRYDKSEYNLYKTYFLFNLPIHIEVLNQFNFELLDNKWIYLIIKVEDSYLYEDKYGNEYNDKLGGLFVFSIFFI